LTISIFDYILVPDKITIFDIREGGTVAREKFQTLTEQMFYILLCLRRECCGADVMAQVQQRTGGRVSVGPGTLYNLLEQFLSAGMIAETKVEGRKRSYLITDTGRAALEEEYRRLRLLAADYEACMREEETP
jgi:DNA-binding PadR family transcriptional regulator